MNKLLSFSIVFLAAMFLSGSVFSQEYTVGVEELDYYPFYDGTNGGYKGFAKDFLEMFAKEKGYKFKYVARPINRLFKVYASGKVDFKFPDNPYWQKDLKKGKKIVYSEPVAGYIDGVMVVPENKGGGLDKLKILGTIMGFTAWDYLGLAKEGKVKIYENSSFAGLVKQVKKGRVDGAYLNPAVCAYRLNYSKELVFDEGLPHTKSSYYISSFKHPEIIEEINAFMKKNAEAIKKLKVKYGVDI